MSKISFILLISWAVLCIAAIFLGLLFRGGEQHVIYTYYSSFLELLIAALASFFCFYNRRLFLPNDPVRKAWSTLGIAVLFWTGGAFLSLVYPITHSGQETPFPWYSDIGYLLFIPLVLSALMTLRLSLNVAIPFWAWISAFIIATSISLLALIINAETLKQIGIAAFMTTMAYVVFTPMLMTMIIITASVLIGHPICRPWWFALTGLFIFSIGAFLHVLLHNLNILKQGIWWLDLTWPLAFGLIALAATMTCTMSNRPSTPIPK